MSLYLCVFERERELAGVEVGGYDDFDRLRRHVAEALEAGRPGDRFPLFQHHSDCEGDWPAADCAKLREEFAAVRAGLAAAGTLGNFLDVEGEPLLDQLLLLVDAGLAAGQPIHFQ